MSNFKTLVDFVRKNSPYYRQLYRNIPQNCDDISAYPIVDQEQFWQASANQQVLTDRFHNGIVFKSGGTTGNPKFSYFTPAEWNHFTAVSGRGFRHNGVQAGDRIANLFYAGELYASFLYVTAVIDHAGVGINYPIGGQTDIATMVEMIDKLQINVIAGVPTTLIHIIAYLQQHPHIRPNIDLILYGGEPFYADQLDAIATVLPTARVHSILYASVDGGELGYFDAQTCANGEHRCFDESTIMEIVDEDTLEPIIEPGITGRLIVTNLNRKLMPLIRYPVGDMAQWCEPAGMTDRRFRLCGRSQEGARIGPATLYVQDVATILDAFHDKLKVLNFQIVIKHYDARDQAVIHIVPEKIIPGEKAQRQLAEQILQHLYTQRSMLRDLIDSDKIHPVKIAWCRSGELESNPRTGKTLRILDKRLGA